MLVLSLRWAFLFVGSIALFAADIPAGRNSDPTYQQLRNLTLGSEAVGVSNVSGVDDRFRMLVPIYLELADGRTVSLGRANLIGNSSIERKVPLQGVKVAPKRALVNYNYDVLASN